MHVDAGRGEPEERVAAVAALRVERFGEPDPHRWIGIPEPLRHDTDDRARDVIQRQPATDDRGLAAQLLPQPIAENGHWLGTLRVVANARTPAEEWLRAEHLEQLAGNR